MTGSPLLWQLRGNKRCQTFPVRLELSRAEWDCHARGKSNPGRQYTTVVSHCFFKVWPMKNGAVFVRKVEQDVPHNFVATWLICNLQLRRGEGPMPFPGRVQCNLVTWSWDFVAKVTRPSSDPHCLHCWFMADAVSPKMASFTLNRLAMQC